MAQHAALSAAALLNASLSREEPKHPKTVTLAIENMTCGGCMRKVEHALLGVPGVISARANLSTRRATVVFRQPQRGEALLVDAFDAFRSRYADLRQANDDMRRAASENASAADSRRAADRLRQATDLLGGLQQQDAGSRLNSMAQAAEQLAARQKQQADHVRDLIAQQNTPRPGQKPYTPTAQEIDRMVNDRQQLSDDLGRLTQQMRTSARELSRTQPAASNKLRGALEGMDQNDLGTRLQRSSDQLRGGQFSDPAETALTGDLQKLEQQINDAARALGGAQISSKDGDINRAMDRALHIQRVVIVTPSFYGTDNSATLYGMKARGPDARGIAVIDEKTPAADLDAMDRAGRVDRG